MVRRHAVVRMFHTLSVPFAALASTWSSLLTASARTSCLCPGSSTECTLVGSGSLPSASLLLPCGTGIVNASSELFDCCSRTPNALPPSYGDNAKERTLAFARSTHHVVTRSSHATGPSRSFMSTSSSVTPFFLPFSRLRFARRCRFAFTSSSDRRRSTAVVLSVVWAKISGSEGWNASCVTACVDDGSGIEHNGRTSFGS